MLWASVHSTARESREAARRAAQDVLMRLEGSRPDLVLTYFSGHHLERADAIHEVLTDELSPGCLAGIGSTGVLSNREELQDTDSLVVFAGALPGVGVAPVLFPGGEGIEAADDPDAFSRQTPGLAESEIVLLFGDPFTLNLRPLLQAFNHHLHSVPIVGGMASGANQPGKSALFLNDWTGNTGGFAIGLSGDIRADVIVSQGCTPLGPALEVTRARHNIIRELDGMPAAERLQQVLEELSDLDQSRLRQGLLVGRPIRRGAKGLGHYLIRTFIGHDQRSGALAVGDVVRERERLRLHVRDESTARDDLRMLLAPQEFDTPASGALLFPCNGRGRHLYSGSNGDLAQVRDALGEGVPVAGMFCAGEIGPLGGTNFVHGHTASLVIFRSA